MKVVGICEHHQHIDETPEFVSKTPLKESYKHKTDPNPRLIEEVAEALPGLPGMLNNQPEGQE